MFTCYRVQNIYTTYYMLILLTTVCITDSFLEKTSLWSFPGSGFQRQGPAKHGCSFLGSDRLGECDEEPAKPHAPTPVRSPCQVLAWPHPRTTWTFSGHQTIRTKPIPQSATPRAHTHNKLRPFTHPSPSGGNSSASVAGPDHCLVQTADA